MSKRTLVLNAFNKKEVERVPVGFWFHFLPENQATSSSITPEIVQKNIQGHKKYIEHFSPDFVKLMSDGFMLYPNFDIANAKSIYDLKRIKPIGENHVWIREQIKLVKALKKLFFEDILSFYNIFSPSKYFKFHFENGDQVLANFILEDPKLTRSVLNVIAEDIALLIEKLITEVEIDGIYFSVQNIQDERISDSEYLNTISPSDRFALNAANRISENNILHICSHRGAKNKLELFQNYPAKVVSWGTKAENLSLSDGKKFFKGKAVLGGFDNTTSGVLYTGPQEKIEKETEKILNESGTKGLILGADCSLPNDINLSHLTWVRNHAIQFSSVPVGGLK